MITRFAPSPTGPLHLGHAYSALLAFDTAQTANGTFLLRIEDTDSTRVRPEHATTILEDLHWLGCAWEAPRRQSDHVTEYWQTLETLQSKGLIFPCACNRRTILTTGAVTGADGPVYPATCAHRPMSDAKSTDAIRLNLTKSLQHLPETLSYTDQTSGDITFHPADMIKTVGHPILRRINTGDPAYHLACTHDDALQNVTHVIRGQDVAPLTQIHVVLQHLMGWHTPIYHHHALINDETGKRLAKIDHAKSLKSYRDAGATPTDIRKMVGLATSSVPEQLTP